MHLNHGSLSEAPAPSSKGYERLRQQVPVSNPNHIAGPGQIAGPDQIF